MSTSPNVPRAVRSVAASTGPALTIQHLTKQFGGLRAIDDITLEVPQGKVYGFIGPNGAGKTTLLNLISGFITPTEGRITTFGTDITGLPAQAVARAGVARTYQNVRLFEGMTVRENIAVGVHQHRSAGAIQAVVLRRGERRERRETRAVVDRLMKTVGLPDNCGDQPAESLSYGDQRRCEIARALATRPRLLLLDEPAAGMNSKESSALAVLLEQLCERGLTVVLIEHNMEMVLRCCNEIAVLVFGQLVATGDSQECLARQDVREAYFGRSADSERIRTLLGSRTGAGPK
jgi:branched-chain amino acid transport system ATP-binding protein